MPRSIASITRAALLSMVLLAAACAGDDGADATTSGGDGGGTITVLAAASLTGAFTDIAAAFEDAHPGVQVDLSFDGSSRLAAAIVDGAPADVFASADEASMSTVVEAGATSGDAVVFATNELQIVVAKGNPLGVASLEDLVDGDLQVALCGPAVPCGRYAAAAFAAAGLPVPAGGEEENVKGVLTKVQLGEADAGLVYVTDVLAARDVEGIDLPDDVQVPATYPAAALADGANPTGASAFVAFLRGDAAQAILAAAGFGRP